MSIKKRVNRFLGITLAVIMMVCAPLTAFAAETENEDVIITNSTVSVDDGVSTMVLGEIVSGTVGVNGEINLYPYLTQGSVFGRTFCVRTSSTSKTGAIFLYLYDKNGNIVSHDWIMGVSESMNQYLLWPSYGTYTLKIDAQANTAPVTVDAWWQ